MSQPENVYLLEQDLGKEGSKKICKFGDMGQNMDGGSEDY